MIETSGKMSRRLSLGIMLMAAPVFVLALGVLYVQSHNLIHEQVTKRVTNTLNATQHYVRNYMKTIETAANVNMWMMERNFNPDSLQSVSNRIVTLNPNVCSSSVFVVPGMMKGQELLSLYTVRQDDNVVTYKETTYDYRDKALYALPVSTGHACWIDPYKDNIEWGVDPNKAVATYCLPIKQDDGRIIGVVATEFLFNHLAKILKEAENPYPNAYYIMLSSDGRYLIHPDSTQLFRKTIFTDADPGSDNDIISLGHQMIERKQGSMHIETHGETYHVCYQPVADTDWSLALVCPNNEAMESYYKLGYLIIALLVIGLLGIRSIGFREAVRCASSRCRGSFSPMRPQ